MALIKLSASERRRVSAFITCLVLAILAWIFTTLSNPVRFGVKVVLNYKNAPQKRAFRPLQPDTITDTLIGTGWQMLFSGMSDQNRHVNVDLRALENKDYVVLSSQLRQINDQKDFDKQIVAFTPDTLFFDFSDRATKKVPVKLPENIKFQQQFAQSSDLVIRPAYVTISGPQKAIGNITSWAADSLVLDSVNETIKVNQSLEPPKEGNISVYPRSVQVILPVDEYTEKTVQIPVKLINNRDYYNVKIFPQKVKVTFTTSLNRYHQMNEDLFEAVADLDFWREHNYSNLPVELTRVPAYCRIVKIEPQNVDFIVRK
ncbi:MAG: YbbR-like domain-containing protein [Bacteroidetes bacterium]|nr:YbbR-like domain-containing protein [Bacteroidota bacterium]